MEPPLYQSGWLRLRRRNSKEAVYLLLRFLASAGVPGAGVPGAGAAGGVLTGNFSFGIVFGLNSRLWLRTVTRARDLLAAR